MGTLTSYLQREFTRLCPPGWTCQTETQLLSQNLADRLGYAPRADVRLEKEDGSKRLWIEFEVSRADPVANHAKFATSHLFQPLRSTDTFLAMVSPHVVRGRRNLAANTVLLMRYIGMNAFQTVLFPQFHGEKIKELNHLSLPNLFEKCVPVKAEVERALSIAEPVLVTPKRRLHFVGDIMDVMSNLRRWNEELTTQEGRSLWRKRTITYFVFDPNSGNFAPSKFCAYMAMDPSIPSKNIDVHLSSGITTLMELSVYVTLDSTDHAFDGGRARLHLIQRLAMLPKTADEKPELASLFEQWLIRHANSISVHPSGPIFLLPPTWFR